MADVRDVAGNIAPRSIAHVAAEIAPIVAEVDTVTMDVEAVRTNIAVAVSPPVGLGTRRDERGASSRARDERNHELANHGTSPVPVFAPPTVNRLHDVCAR